ncbi:MAG: L,D-transpeptidase [Erysipelotrichaceae bacterium]|nr:L,D-transpeptidase [Erysipelotrichaceae bacterium]
MHRIFENKKRVIIILAIILAVLSVYLFGMVFFSSHFLPRTMINGTDVSLKNSASANELLKDLKPEITIIQKTSDGNNRHEQKLSLKDISSDITYDVSENIKDQNIVLWFTSLFNQKELEPSKVNGRADANKINDLVDTLYCLQEENIVKPVNAHYELKDDELVLVRSSDGSYIKESAAVKTVRDYINQLFAKTDSLTLDLTGLYEKAEILDDDPSLDGKKAYLEKVLNKKVELNIYDETIELDKKEVSSLFDFIDSEPIVNEDRLSDFVLKLAIENDGSSSYINKPELKTNLENCLLSVVDEKVDVTTLSGQPIRRVEVKINEQTLYYYEDDVLTLKSPIVSGNKELTDETPHGKFEVRRKVTDTQLRGRDYIEHVDYWVGFDETGGIYGLHDAQWRDEFGGDIWTYDPSRGCVNMPLDKIGILFERLRLADEITVMD